MRYDSWLSIDIFQTAFVLINRKNLETNSSSSSSKTLGKLCDCLHIRKQGFRFQLRQYSHTPIMTATSEGKCSKKSKGFTIDSLIGKDSDKPTETEKESCEISDNVHSAVSRVLHIHKDQDHGPVPDGRGFEHKHEHSDRERSPDLEHHRIKEALVLKSLEHRNVQRNSLHRDSLRDVNFNTPATLRSTSPESLKHFHEVLMQNASANTGVGLPLGHYEAQRSFRHPLSTINMAGYPGHMPGHPQIHPMLLNGAARDLRHMYPYFTDRYPSHVVPRYGMAGVPGLFFQPYRKPKRIRTAFSPSQLLQLEKSFEKSHYVVGQERKDLANELQLSETQVKVWFQNRRTKYKRTKQEQDDGSGGDKHDPGSPYQDSHNEDSDISDIDDIDDVKDSYVTSAHAYQNPIQTC